MFDILISYIKNNPVLSSLVGVYLATQLSSWIKIIPEQVLKFITKHLTTQFSIMNNNTAFYDLMKIIDENKVTDQVRIIRIVQKYYNFVKECDAIKGIGIGSHIVKMNGKYIRMTLSEYNESASSSEKLKIDIQYFGRNHAFMNDIIEQLKIKHNNIDTNKTKILQYSNGWSVKVNQTKRNIKNVILSEFNENVLFTSIDKFIDNKSWYVKHQIPYTLGILLEGPPGTGKTSIIKAIAAKYNYSIAILETNQISNLESAIASLPDKSIIVLEDVDRFLNMMNSLNGDNHSEKFDNVQNYTLGISSLLNSIDGCVSIDGRILIVTANKINDMDSALMRPGRFDIKLHIGYVDEYMFNKFMSLFFNEHKFTKFNNKNVTVAELQNDILLDMKYEQMIQKYGEH